MDERRYGNIGNEIVSHFEKGCPMISVDLAWQLVAREFATQLIEDVSLEASLGRVLGENILADRDGPPFDRVAMDGIAILSKKLETQRVFKLESVAKAGEPQVQLLNPDNAIEVMTGAPLPLGCDTVIRYEDLIIENGLAQVYESVATKIVNVHFKGSDFKKDDIIVDKGALIHAPMIGILASSGMSPVKVLKLPKVAVVSTGDELVGVNETPLDHQIRRSNLYALTSALESFGLNSIQQVHLPDDPQTIFDSLKALLEKVDVVILSGGVSEGKFDFIPQTLADLGVEKLFHKIAQKPGKPLWFGKKDKKIIFALPGNPVSSLVCLRRYFIEALIKQNDSSEIINEVILEAGLEVKGDRVFFAAVKLKNKNGQILARPVLGNGSGDYLTLKNSDGFVELDPAKGPFIAGQTVVFFSWRKL